MIERLLDRDLLEFRLWRIEKRAAAGREPDALDFADPSATHALVHGVVLAIDGKQRLALAARLGGDQFTRGDQAFLVRETYGFAGAHGFVCRFESRNADN